MSKPAKKTALSTVSREARADVYEQVTAKIIASLEAGAGNWERPWTRLGGSIQPINVISRKPYRGINTFALFIAADDAGYTSSEWGTFKQWQSLSTPENPVCVRKGEKATLGVFFKSFETANDDAEGDDDSKKTGVFAKAFYLFNAAQIDGYCQPVPVLPSAAERIDTAETYFANTRAIIRHGGDRAFYRPSGDFIQLPTLEQFADTLSYYGTLAHEVGHWTGHETRCKRDLKGRFGSEDYAAEELVAELAAAFLSARLGLTQEPREDHAQYLGSWLKVLRNDKRAIFTAASLAQKAVDYLDSLQPAATTADAPLALAA